MEFFIKKPTPARIAELIYHQVIATHETGGRWYKYKIPKGLSISFINEVIDTLGEYLIDVDLIELMNDYIIIDWS